MCLLMFVYVSCNAWAVTSMYVFVRTEERFWAMRQFRNMRFCGVVRAEKRRRFFQQGVPIGANIPGLEWKACP